MEMKKSAGIPFSFGVSFFSSLFEDFQNELNACKIERTVSNINEILDRSTYISIVDPLICWSG